MSDDFKYREMIYDFKYRDEFDSYINKRIAELKENGLILPHFYTEFYVTDNFAQDLKKSRPADYCEGYFVFLKSREFRERMEKNTTPDPDNCAAEWNKKPAPPYPMPSEKSIEMLMQRNVQKKAK